MIRMRRALALAAKPFVRVASWWSALEPPERVLYRAVALSAVGFGMKDPALAFIVPAVLFALTFFGFNFGLRRGT